MGKYFGTDGFRGEANVTLTADHAYQVGRFLGWYCGECKRRGGDSEPAKVVIGKDTRRSSYMFEYALASGLVASGADAYLLHVTTTPSVSYVARTEGFDCGIMISASHNPFYDNGIKLIGRSGEKMDEDTIALIEDYLDGKLSVFGQTWETLPLAQRDHIGRTVDWSAGRNRYVGYLISLGMFSFKGKKVGLDCANGSAWMIARSVFDALGATTSSWAMSQTASISTTAWAPLISRPCSASWWRKAWTWALPTTATRIGAWRWTKRARSSPATTSCIFAAAI